MKADAEKLFQRRRLQNLRRNAREDAARSIYQGDIIRHNGARVQGPTSEPPDIGRSLILGVSTGLLLGALRRPDSGSDFDRCGSSGTAFHNQYWPAHYFIDAKGNIRGHHFGEGE
jgi:hypothetical protein